MTQQVVFARVSFPSLNDFTDMSSNSFTWEATGSDTTLDLSEVSDNIHDFYDVTPPGGAHPLSYYLSSELSRVADSALITYYDVTATLTTGRLGGPIGTHTFTLGASHASGVVPAGLAVAIGYRAAYGADPEHSGSLRPRARDRARIYLGPVDQVAINGTDGSVTAQMRDDCGRAIKALAGTHFSGLHDQHNLVVWSRAAGVVKAVDSGFYYVDEGFASQRRREDTTLTRIHTWLAV